MYVILLRFAENSSSSAEYAAAHRAWIQRGLDDGVFLVVGSLSPKQGGAILAHQATRSALETRVGEDPFVAEGVVSAEILEIVPSLVDERLRFLLGAS